MKSPSEEEAIEDIRSAFDLVDGELSNGPNTCDLDFLVSEVFKAGISYAKETLIPEAERKAFEAGASEQRKIGSISVMEGSGAPRIDVTWGKVDFDKWKERAKAK